MFAVVCPEEGVMELNYMWLPTWIGMNTALLRDLEEKVQEAVLGIPADQAEEVGHKVLVDTLEQRFPELVGLRNYLDSLRQVSM